MEWNLLQAATATVTQAPMPSVMQLLGTVTAIATLVLAICAACIYAYKLGVLKRDGEATRADAVRSSETLAAEVRSGFKTVHRRMDSFDNYVRESQEFDLQQAAWRADIGGRVERVEGDVQEVWKAIEDRRVGPSDRRES